MNELEDKNSLEYQLRVRGFAVIPNFLSEEQLQQVVERYHKNESTFVGRKVIPCAPSFLREALGETLDRALDEMKSEDFHPETYGGGAYFATERGVNFVWHQEHTYYWYQTHRHNINFFIPIIKPELSKGNLSIVPADNFIEKDADLWKRLEWGGSRRIEADENRPGHTKLMDDWLDKCVATVPFKLDDIALTPQLNAGDALLVRGDIFHQTQDTETARVALSVRAWSDSVPLSLEHLLTSKKSAKFVASNCTSKSKNWNYDFASMEEVLREHQRKQKLHLLQSGEELPPITFGEAREQVKVVQQRQRLEKEQSAGGSVFNCCVC